MPKRELETVALPSPLPGASDLPSCEALPGVGAALDNSHVDALMELLTDDDDHCDDNDDGCVVMEPTMSGEQKSVL